MNRKLFRVVHNNHVRPNTLGTKTLKGHMSFTDENGVLWFYQPRKNLTKDDIVEMFVREKYSANDEFKVQRKRDTEPENFEIYYNFVEDCIKQAEEFITVRNEWDWEN